MKNFKRMTCCTLFLIFFLASTAVFCSADEMTVYNETFSAPLEFTFNDYSSFTAYQFNPSSSGIGRVIGLNTPELIQKDGCLTLNGDSLKSNVYIALDNSGQLPVGTYIFSAQVKIASLGADSCNLMYVRMESEPKMDLPGFMLHKDGEYLSDLCGDQDISVYDNIIGSADFITLAVKYDFNNMVYALYVDGKSVAEGDLTSEQYESFAGGSKPSFRLIAFLNSKVTASDNISFRNATVYRTDNPYTVTVDGKLWSDGKLFTGTFDGAEYENGVKKADISETATSEETTAPAETKDNTPDTSETNPITSDRVLGLILTAALGITFFAVFNKKRSVCGK